ncbi:MULTISPECIES: GGDEF domain-containing protein [unclassified Massilia]|uniref:GGDEF domain-containing protein n=1 Tax=unclassified Massilia TaxID=2609279 RepID=UPI001783BE10|nr:MULTISPECIES: GGDEF domain-containing protein [unclassified Massilia]MBD8529697.1 GGDEF domain-containing protein [Massilia sp. CFBP 13647]MBD8673216.1 GGDEF domain-containing protein [Massilia sp. CFBP 13721]
MSFDIASLLVAMTLSVSTMALALTTIMGKVNRAARLAQAGAVLQAVGWSLLLASGAMFPGGAADFALSVLSMACLSSSFACNAAAFELWCGRTAPARAPAIAAFLMTAGYAAGFSHYAFRVGWANGWLAVQMALTIATLACRPSVPVGRWRWLLVAGLTAQMIVTVWRGVLGAFFTEQFPAFLTPHPVNLAFAMVTNVTAVLSMVSILLAHRDEAARALERLATTDSLTGALNRRAWLLQADVELANSIRYQRPIGVLMIDLDHFKHINDTRGHEAGDHALQFFAQALRATCRTGDSVCRYGGEEFCVLLMSAEADAARAFDQPLRAYLLDASLLELGHRLDYSAGVALRGLGEARIADILRRADQALYRAKALGRGCTVDAIDMPTQSAVIA